MLRISFYVAMLVCMFTPLNTYAYYAGGSSPASCAFYGEVISLAIIIVGVGFMITVMHKLTGLLKRAWIFLAGAFTLFFVLHLMAIIALVSGKSVNLLFCIVEFIMLILALLSIITFKQIFEKLASKKSADKKQSSIDQLSPK